MFHGRTKDRRRGARAPRRFSRTQQRWLVGLAVVIVVAALRFPWLEADGGNAGFWSYGVFTTDEGYNTAAGRLAYLTGKFFDPELLEPINFTTSWSMGLLSYLGYLVGGLTWGAARLPTLTAAVLGWFLAYWLASRATTPLLAGLVTLVLSCNPMSLTYERVHNTDVIVAALAILAYVQATSRRTAWSAVAGVVLALGLSVKTTTLGLVPLVLLGSVMTRRDVVRRLASLAVCFAVCFTLLWVWRQAVIASAGGRGNELVARTLIPIIAGSVVFQWEEMLRALSIFPRWPMSVQMGPLLLWLLVLPVWYVLQDWSRTHRWATRRSVVFLGVLAYVGFLATQPQAPLRRVVLALLYFVPAMFVYGRAAMLRIPQQRMRAALGVAAACLLSLGLYWMPRGFSQEELQGYRYNEYIVPAKVTWGLSWPIWMAGVVALGVGMRMRFPSRCRCGEWAFIVGVVVSVTWVFFSNYSLAAQGLRGTFLGDQVLIQISTVVFVLVLMTAHPWGRWRTWYVCGAGLFLGFALMDSTWRVAYQKEATRAYVERDGSRQLATIIPPNSIVVGRRSTTLLRQTPCRLGITMPIWEPAKFFADVERLLTRYPDRPLYVLLDADPQTPPAVAYLQQHQGKFQFQHVATLQQYADGAAQLVPLYAVRIALTQPPVAAPSP